MNDKEIVAEWQKTGLLHGMVDPIKEMAWMLENTRDYMKTSMHSKKHRLVNFMFPIVRRVYSNLLYRNDGVTVQTMKGPMDIVHGVKIVAKTERLGVNFTKYFLDGDWVGGFWAIDNEVEITSQLSDKLTEALESLINQKRLVDEHNNFYFYNLITFDVDPNNNTHFFTKMGSSE